MGFREDVAAFTNGDFAPFSQTQYIKTDVGAVVHQNVEALDTPNRVPGLCAGLSAAFLIIMKNLLVKTPEMNEKDMLKGFADYCRSPDGAAVVGTVQRDVDATKDPVSAEVAIADFFSEGLGNRSLKHSATVSGSSLTSNSLTDFVANTPGYDMLTFGTTSGVGHTMAAINLAITGKKPQIIVYDPNGGFTRLAKDPQNQMGKFTTAWLASKWGNSFGGQPFVFSRYT
jgi:hypothetical protein